MGMVRIATVVLVLIAAPVFASDLVAYEVQLGGDNHAASIQAGTRVAYTSGSAADGQTFVPGVLNWAASLAVSGIHSQPGHASDGLAPQGVANFVFNLELHSGSATGPLVTNVNYYSTIHSGTSGLTCTNCAGGYTIPGPTAFCAGAAFTYVFDFVGWGAGTVLEALSVAQYTGPFMEVGMYPTVDVTNSSGEGQLLGMGAGYGQWSRGAGYPTQTTRGVGIPTSVTGGLGVLPLVEGQIDTSSLAAGTYVLKLTPGSGHNVLRGDVDLVTNGPPQVQAFAVPANQVTGDTITFTIGAGTPLSLVSSYSVKTHGLAGDFGVPSGSWEGRVSGTQPLGPSKIVTTFNENIQRINNNSSDVSVSSGTVGSITVAGNVLTVTLTNITNRATFTIGYPGIASATDANQKTTQTNCWQVLAGEASGPVGGSLQVNSSDYIAVRGMIDQPITSANFTTDVNADGEINSSDYIAIRSWIDSTSTLPATCP